jgi:hypothetical protein
MSSTWPGNQAATLESRQSIQAHYLEPGALPSCQGRHCPGQPVTGFLILADHNRFPLGSGVDQPRSEPLFREPVHKLANSLLYSRKFIRNRSPCVILTHNGHPNNLPGGPGITKLPSLLGPLSLPAPRGTPNDLWLLPGPFGCPRTSD